MLHFSWKENWVISPIFDSILTSPRPFQGEVQGRSVLHSTDFQQKHQQLHNHSLILSHTPNSNIQPHSVKLLTFTQQELEIMRNLSKLWIFQPTSLLTPDTTSSTRKHITFHIRHFILSGNVIHHARSLRHWTWRGFYHLPKARKRRSSSQIRHTHRPNVQPCSKSRAITSLSLLLAITLLVAGYTTRPSIQVTRYNGYVRRMDGPGWLGRAVV